MFKEQKENGNPYNEQSRGKHKIDATNSVYSQMIFKVDQQMNYKLHQVD